MADSDHEALGEAMDRIEGLLNAVMGGMTQVVSDAVVQDREGPAAVKLNAAADELTTVARRHGLYDDED